MKSDARSAMSKSIFRLGWVLLCAALHAYVHAEECARGALPEHFSIEYEASARRGPLALDGEATLEFKREGQQYSLNTALTATRLFWLKQVSEGTVLSGALRPQHYVETRTRRDPAEVKFDWHSHKVSFSDGSHAPTRTGVQDRASAFLQLSLLHRAQPKANSIEFGVASLRHINAYRFARRETAALELPLGTVEAVRYERIVEEGEDKLELWLATAYCALPVRIRLRDSRGQDIDQQARRVTMR